MGDASINSKNLRGPDFIVRPSGSFRAAAASAATSQGEKQGPSQQKQHRSGISHWIYVIFGTWPNQNPPIWKPLEL